jgi:hypothetical protein
MTILFGKRKPLVSNQFFPPGIVSIVVYIFLFRLCSMLLLSWSVPRERPAEILVLREPIALLFATNIFFIAFLVANVIAFPWRETSSKYATAFAYVVAGGVLLLIQYVQAVMLWCMSSASMGLLRH